MRAADSPRRESPNELVMRTLNSGWQLLIALSVFYRFDELRPAALLVINRRRADEKKDCGLLLTPVRCLLEESSDTRNMGSL